MSIISSKVNDLCISIYNIISCVNLVSEDNAQQANKTSLKCLRKLKMARLGGSDGIVGELLKYSGSGMVDLLEQLFSVI